MRLDHEEVTKPTHPAGAIAVVVRGEDAERVEGRKWKVDKIKTTLSGR